MDLELALGKEIVEASKDEYEQLIGMWRDLERKAQITIATAGVFFAAIFTFIRTIDDISKFEQFLLVIIVSLLALTIFSTARVLKGKTVKRIPKSQIITEWADRIRTDHSSEGYWDYYTDCAAQWQNSIQSIENKYKEKSADLESAHELLYGALFVIFLMSICEIFMRG